MYFVSSSSSSSSSSGKKKEQHHDASERHETQKDEFDNSSNTQDHLFCSQGRVQLSLLVDTCTRFV